MLEIAVMDPFGRSKNNQMNQKPAAELPQWNARFRFTAQKGTSAAADDSKDGRDAAKASQMMLTCNHRYKRSLLGPFAAKQTTRASYRMLVLLCRIAAYAHPT